MADALPKTVEGEVPASAIHDGLCELGRVDGGDVIVREVEGDGSGEHGVPFVMRREEWSEVLVRR